MNLWETLAFLESTHRFIFKNQNAYAKLSLLQFLVLKTQYIKFFSIHDIIYVFKFGSVDATENDFI